MVIPLPIKGVYKGVPEESQPAGTSGYMSNCRPFDVLRGQLRLGQRPGLEKSDTGETPTQIGGETMPIVAMAMVTILQ